MIRSPHIPSVPTSSLVGRGGGGGGAADEANPNLLLWSEEFQQAAWVKSAGITVTADQTLAPDGTNTADLLDATSELRFLEQDVAASQGGLYTASVHVKGGPLWLGEGGIELLVRQDGGNIALVDFAVSSDWQRVSWTGTVGEGPTSVGVRIYPDIGGHGINVYAWGAKLEEGAVATAYVKREGT